VSVGQRGRPHPSYGSSSLALPSTGTRSEWPFSFGAQACCSIPSDSYRAASQKRWQPYACCSVSTFPAWPGVVSRAEVARHCRPHTRILEALCSQMRTPGEGEWHGCTTSLRIVSEGQVHGGVGGGDQEFRWSVLLFPPTTAAAAASAADDDASVSVWRVAVSSAFGTAPQIRHRGRKRGRRLQARADLV
jgi:hypothetical protein